MELELEFYNVADLDRNLKATTHKSGKMGFTIEAAKKMNLEGGKSLGIAYNAKDENDKSLYVVVYPDDRVDALRVNKAGSYYYINTKPLLDKLQIDYKNVTVIYDISEEKYKDMSVFKFTRRERPKKTLREALKEKRTISGASD